MSQASENKVRGETRVAVLEEVWAMLKETPHLDVKGYEFHLLNKRQVLGDVTEMLSKARKAA